jgi:hypothetical protein
MSSISFEDNTEELKFIQIELDQLIVEYEKTYNEYIKKIRQQKSTTTELQKLDEINETIKRLVDRVKTMQPDFEDTKNENSSLFTQIKAGIKKPFNNLQDERIKLNNITDEVKDLANKNKDGKLNNKSINAKYLIISLFVIIIIFLAVRTFIYLEINNIDIIILISIIFLIIYQFI